MAAKRSRKTDPIVRILPFMRWRLHAAGLSLALMLLSIGALAIRGLDFGLDFSGGTLVEARYEREANLPEIRAALESAGHEDFTVALFGSARDVLIRLASGTDDELGARLLQLLRGEAAPGDRVELQRIEFVGPQVGAELREQGGLALLSALLLVMLYVAFRFQFKFAVGAVAALIHDTLIVLGMFALFGLSFDLTVLAALLAVIGYSLNDTIVVSDRMRENFRALRKRSVIETLDRSLSETLGRTIVTSLTTLLVLFALLIFGGELIRGFALALIMGVLVGTWSSVYVVSNVLILMKVDRMDLALPEKEGEDQPPEDRLS